MTATASKDGCDIPLFSMTATKMEIGSVSPLEYTQLLQSIFNVKPNIQIEYVNAYPEIFQNANNTFNNDILYDNKSISPISPNQIWKHYNAKTYLEYYNYILKNIEVICVRYFNIKLNAGKRKNFTVININSEESSNNNNGNIKNHDDDDNNMLLFKCHPCILYELSDRFVMWFDEKSITQKLVDYMSLYFLFESNSKSVQFDIRDYSENNSNSNMKDENDKKNFAMLKRSLDVDLGSILGFNTTLYANDYYNYNRQEIFKDLYSRHIEVKSISNTNNNNYNYTIDFENLIEKNSRIDEQEKKDFFELIKSFISENDSMYYYSEKEERYNSVDDISLMKANHNKHALTIGLYLLLNKTIDLFQIYQSQNYTLHAFKSSIPSVNFDFSKTGNKKNVFNNELTFMSDF
ncbi:MAG: hypothetical protein [Cotesia congregata filamentous virus 2]